MVFEGNGLGGADIMETLDKEKNLPLKAAAIAIPYRIEDVAILRSFFDTEEMIL